MHAVAVVRPRPRLPGLRQLHLLLGPEGLRAVQELPGLLAEDVLREEDFMRAAPAGAAFRGRPGAGLETTAEAVLAVVTLVVVREETESKAVRETAWSSQTSLCSVDISADGLTLGPRHDVLVPVQQPVVPVALLVYLDVATAALSGGFRSRGRLGGRNQGFPGGRVGRGWNQRFPRRCMCGCWN